MSRRAALLLAVALAAGCRSTELVVVVRSDLPSLQAVRINLYTAGGPVSATTTPDLFTPCGCVGDGPGCTPLPLQLGLVPKDVDRSGPFTVEAVAYGDARCSTPLVGQRARVTFVKGERVELLLDLLQDCSGVRCDAPDSTCRHHACVPDDVPQLPPFDPGQPIPSLDGGGSSRDGGGPPRDGGVDLVIPDSDGGAPTGDLGPPPGDLGPFVDDLAPFADDLQPPFGDDLQPPFGDDLQPPFGDDLQPPFGDLGVPPDDLAPTDDAGDQAAPFLDDLGPLRFDGGCFLAGTLVDTAGGPRPIESLAVGADVLALDAERPLAAAPTGTRVARAVGHLAGEVVALRFGAVTVVATVEHPFYVPGHGWTAAGALARGDGVLDRDGGRVRLDASERLVGSFPVYNVELAEGHAYFVSPLGLAVHNAGGS